MSTPNEHVETPPEETDSADLTNFTADDLSDGEKETTAETDETENEETETDEKIHAAYKLPEGDVRHHLSGMYQHWFLDYASYVILERAVPHLNDGLKPVQRRILHSMKRLDDGRYNKVANIVGHTMQFHPHGDASIGDALVQLGQKELLIDCQGNWGNVLTGDGAAAPRYIEARLSKFALDVVFNAKTTQWKPSYDGRNKEPITLPVKFPLLLVQGVEGIAVGLSSKILPHNFNELIDASIACLKGEPFVLYPDFQTGGYIDVSRYNAGERGGSVKVRAKIEKRDNKTLAITEIPFSKTTSSVIESILKAQEKGKIKIKKVDDNTSSSVEILVHLQPSTSSDKTIDALYAFTDCEVSISPNCCVIFEDKPHFLTVNDVLKVNTDNTRELLRQELEIQREELYGTLHFATLEKIFIQERIYKDKNFEQSNSIDEALGHIEKLLMPYSELFLREITHDDLLRLMEIKMGRIIKFNTAKADEIIAAMNAQVNEINYELTHIVEYAISWFEKLKEKYGKNYPRLTKVRGFDTIEASKVVEANEKLYINRSEGFIGTSLKKDEFVCNCSDIDDIILIYRDGLYKIVKVSEKMFVGKNILYINIFKRNDNRTIYNTIYRDGKDGFYYIKRFAVTGITRDKEYDLTQGTIGSRVVWFTANLNGEAEKLRITLKPAHRLKNLVIEKDFSEIAIKGRQSMGNIVTKNEIQKISLKERGGSTLGGLQVWFDPDVLRLNYDQRGTYLGEFNNGDLILVVLSNGDFYTTSYELSNHYESNILRIEKFQPHKVWTALLHDADQNFPYIKRFQFEATNRKLNFIGENPQSSLIFLSQESYPMYQLILGGGDSFREPITIDAEEYIGVKSYKARGKRLTAFNLQEVKELEPKRVVAESIQPLSDNNENLQEENEEDEQIIPLSDDGLDVVDESIDAVGESIAIEEEELPTLQAPFVEETPPIAAKKQRVSTSKKSALHKDQMVPPMIDAVDESIVIEEEELLTLQAPFVEETPPIAAKKQRVSTSKKSALHKDQTVPPMIDAVGESIAIEEEELPTLQAPFVEETPPIAAKKQRVSTSKKSALHKDQMVPPMIDAVGESIAIEEEELPTLQAPFVEETSPIAAKKQRVSTSKKSALHKDQTVPTMIDAVGESIAIEEEELPTLQAPFVEETPPIAAKKQRVSTSKKSALHKDQTVPPMIDAVDESIAIEEEELPTLQAPFVEELLSIDSDKIEENPVNELKPTRSKATSKKGKPSKESKKSGGEPTLF